MFPTDKGESVSPYVARILKAIRTSSVSHQLTAMGTVFETATMAEALAVLEQAYGVLEPDCERVYAVATFDIRKGQSGRLLAKVHSVEEKLEDLEE